MASKSTSNHTDNYKRCKMNEAQVAKTVNPLSKQMLFTILISGLVKIRNVTRELKIGYGAINELLIIVDHYNRHNEGISQYDLVKMSTMDFGSVIVYDRCKRLVKLGHIECVGRTKQRSPIYIPTFKAIDIIQSHMALTELQSLVDSYSLGRTA